MNLLRKTAFGLALAVLGSSLHASPALVRAAVSATTKQAARVPSTLLVELAPAHRALVEIAPAQRALWKANDETLVAMAKRLTRDPYLREEIQSATALTLVKKPELVSSGPVDPALARTIMKGHLNDALRKQMRELKLFEQSQKMAADDFAVTLPDRIELAVAPGGDPATIVSNRELLYKIVHKSGLTPSERAAVEHKAQGIPDKEAAAELGFTPTAYESYVKHGRNKINRAWNPEGSSLGLE